MSAVYLVAVHNVTDADQLKEYAAAAGGTLTGAEVLVADEAARTVEGDPRSRVVIIRFPSEEAAREWYDSEAYQKALPLRLNATSDNWLGFVSALG